MCKMYLRVGKMSEAVLNARNWLDAMVKRETRADTSQVWGTWEKAND